MTLTYKQRFNLHFGFKKDTPHSIKEISDLTGYKESGLNQIFLKGKGAFFSNRSSVRKHVRTPEQWGMSRVYASLFIGSKSNIIDASHLILKSR